MALTPLPMPTRRATDRTRTATTLTTTSTDAKSRGRKSDMSGEGRMPAADAVGDAGVASELPMGNLASDATVSSTRSTMSEGAVTNHPHQPLQSYKSGGRGDDAPPVASTNFGQASATVS